MLAEFFLTPDAFCESYDGLRQLERCLFPFSPNQPSVAIICRLGNQEWTTALGNKIARIENPNHRVLAMELMKRIDSELAVIRPLATPVTSDESSWVSGAAQSKRDLALEGIVVSNEVSISSCDCTKLSDFVRPGFWDDFGNPRQVQRDRAAQARVLRAFCAFTDWIIVRMPQMRGGSDDEIVTVKQIVEMATTLPPGYRKSNVEIQFPLGNRMKDNPDRAFRSVKAELKEVVATGAEIELTMLPVGSFVNRELLGGEYALVSTGDKIPKARWWMTMSHVAVGGRRDANDRDDANSWNLYSRRDANERLIQLQRVTPLRTERF